MPLPSASATDFALADALRPDPFYLAVTIDHAADAPRRRELLAAYIAQARCEAQRIGRVTWADPPEAGAAFWLLPQPPVVAASATQAKHAELKALLGPQGLANYHAIVDFMGPRADAVVPAGAWYLSIAGIAPALQGAGRGARLLAPVLQEADAQGVPTYLETFTPRNLPFYERLGFRSVVQLQEPVTASPYWVMLRG